MDPVWFFCPHCGTDNRAPDDRVGVSRHEHQFIVPEPCCIWCGCVEGVGAGSKGVQKSLGAISLIAGLILFLVFANFVFVRMTGSGMFAAEIKQLYQMRSRRGATGSTGATLAWIILVIGFFFAYFGFSVLFPRASRRRSPSVGRAYWDYEDDQPWWKRWSR